jgi:hypothetical protein
MHTNYSHTQVGHLMLWVMFILGLYFGFVVLQAAFDPYVVAVVILVLITIASFATLTVVIDDEHLGIKFGYGVFRKHFKLTDIETVKAVKNHWYYGWGIRYWLWPKMWIFNVSGFDAVEIVLKNGKRYRIGTDEVDQLEKELMEAIR